MNVIERQNWSFAEDGDSRQLTLFKMIGLKKGAGAFLGPSPDRLFEAIDNIGAGISGDAVKLFESHGLSQIQLNCHTALMLFLENFLEIRHLQACRETEDSILLRLFGVEVIIQENPGLAIAYFNPRGQLIAA